MIASKDGEIIVEGNAVTIMTDLTFLIMALRKHLPEELVRDSVEMGFAFEMKTDKQILEGNDKLKNLIYQAALKLKEEQNE